MSLAWGGRVQARRVPDCPIYNQQVRVPIDNARVEPPLNDLQAAFSLQSSGKGEELGKEEGGVCGGERLI